MPKSTPPDWACGLDPGAVTTRAASAPVAGDPPRVEVLRTSTGFVSAPGIPDTEFGDHTVVALPDVWWDGGVEGAKEREKFRQKLGGSVSFVPRAVAAMASRPVRDRQIVFTCDVGAYGVTATLSEVDSRAVRALDVETRPGGGATFERAAVADQVSALPTLRAAVAGQRRRATLVLDRAARSARWQQTPVFDDLTLTAAELLSCFAPVAEAIRSCAGALMARCPSVSAVYLFGGLAGLPSVGTALAEVVDGAILLEPEAVALGALRIAQGQLTMAEDTVMFPAHRVLNGRLVADMVPAGKEVTVTPSTTRWLAVGFENRRAHVRLPALAAGRYECGWWPALNTNGVAVLRPAGGGEPVFAPVGESEPIEES